MSTATGVSHTLNVIDNLTAQKRIPVTVNVFISPGLVGDTTMRSIEYDTVNDKYTRFLRDEILAEVAKQYNIRQRCLQPRDHWRVVRRHLRVQCRMVPSRRCSAAWCRASAVSRVFNGIPARSKAATCIRSKFARSPSATSGSGCRMGPTTWKTNTGVGRCRISRWQIR